MAIVIVAPHSKTLMLWQSGNLSGAWIYVDRLCFFCLVFRAVAAYLKVVRRKKPSSAEGMRGGEYERGISPPLVRGVLGASPRDFFLILSASMCVFNGGFMRLGPDFSRLVTKIFLVA